MRKLVSAIAMAAAALVAVPASATTFIYDVDPGSDSIAFGKSNAWFKGFTDFFFFDLAEAGLVSAFVGSYASSPALDVKLSLVSFNGTPLSKISSGDLDLWTLKDTYASAGRQKLQVTGFYGPKGGSYAGTFNFGSAAVPEPAAWAMMITGFGMAGAALRRRRKLTVSYS